MNTGRSRSFSPPKPRLTSATWAWVPSGRTTRYQEGFFGDRLALVVGDPHVAAHVLAEDQGGAELGGAGEGPLAPPVICISKLGCWATAPSAPGLLVVVGAAPRARLIRPGETTASPTEVRRLLALLCCFSDPLPGATTDGRLVGAQLPSAGPAQVVTARQ